MMSAGRCLASVHALMVVAVLGVKLKPDADLELFKPKESHDKTLLKTMDEAIGMQMDRHAKKSTDLEEKHTAVSSKIGELEKSVDGGVEAMMAELEAKAKKRNRLRQKRARRQAEQREKQVVEADESEQTTEVEEPEEDTVKLPMTHAEAKALRRQARDEALQHQLETMQQELEALRGDEKKLESEIKISEDALTPEADRISALEKIHGKKKVKHDLQKEVALIKTQFEMDSKIIQELKDKKAALSEKTEQLQKRLDGGVVNLQAELEAKAKESKLRRARHARRVAKAHRARGSAENESENNEESEAENSADSAEVIEEAPVQPPKTKAEVKELKREARKEAVQHQLDAMQQALEELRRDENQLQSARDTVKTDMEAMKKVQDKIQKLEHKKR